MHTFEGCEYKYQFEVDIHKFALKHSRLPYCIEADKAEIAKALMAGDITQEYISFGIPPAITCAKLGVTIEPKKDHLESKGGQINE